MIRRGTREHTRAEAQQAVAALAEDDVAWVSAGSELARTGGGTTLTLSIHGFRTETIFKHLRFYWGGTLDVLKAFIERRDPPV